MHEISIVNGLAEAAYAYQPAWHGLGAVVDNAPNSEEAIKLAHLDWTVVKEGLQTSSGTPIPGFFATMRSDISRVLGIVSKQYKIVQNIEAFNWLDGLYKDGIIKYESVGALKGGKMVWLLARRPDNLTVVDGDDVEPYILFVNHHDGSGAVKVLPTTVRVVCANTLKVATQDVGRTISITHKGDIQEKLKVAQDVLQVVDDRFNLFVNKAREMAQERINEVDFRAFLDQILPLPDDTKSLAYTKTKLSRDTILNNMYDDVRQAHVRGTKWAALNSVTQFVDHQSRFRTGRKRENVFYNVTFGTGNNLKQKALELLSV